MSYNTKIRSSFMASPPAVSLESLQHLNEVYDISAPLSCSPTFPGDRPYLQEWLAGTDCQQGYSLSSLSMSSHAGTHIDFPSHLFSPGQSQNSYHPGRFIIPAEVISVSGSGPIAPFSLESCRAAQGQALLFKTENSRRKLMLEPTFTRDYVSLSSEAASYCVSRGMGLVGLDYLSLDRFEDESLPVHHILLKNDILILEGLDLSQVAAGRYLLICLPISIENAEASPVRAILVR